MLHGSCHCGAIRIAVESIPGYLIDCNCSICRRYGALWGLYQSEAIKFSGPLDQLTAYIWGKRSIRTLHCKVCGCVTHWEPITVDAGSKFGINMRNFESDAIRRVAIRKFDGENCWSYSE